MTDTQNDLLKLIHETKAVSIWSHKTGPVFWYAASVPGPFYVNTELVIGPELAPLLLDQITNIIAETSEPTGRATKLNDAILSAYKNSAMYQRVIAAMIAKAKTEFPAGSYDVISGGERRDWLFSIPLAHEIGIDHVYLFKDHSAYCKRPLKNGEKALHVADLINNAASYFDLWFPILAQAKLECIGTLCVNTRGSNGLNRLTEYGLKTVTLNGVDTAFFEKSLAGGLIDRETLTEITAYFSSPQEWARKYLMKDVELFDVQALDKKSFERLQSFFTKDPWNLRKNHADFFASMQKEIDLRLKA
jgi:orotate phosphoribosyltransferase